MNSKLETTNNNSEDLIRNILGGNKASPESQEDNFAHILGISL